MFVFTLNEMFPLLFVALILFAQAYEQQIFMLFVGDRPKSLSLMLSGRSRVGFLPIFSKLMLKVSLIKIGKTNF